MARSEFCRGNSQMNKLSIGSLLVALILSQSQALSSAATSAATGGTAVKQENRLGSERKCHTDTLEGQIICPYIHP